MRSPSGWRTVTWRLPPTWPAKVTMPSALGAHRVARPRCRTRGRGCPATRAGSAAGRRRRPGRRRAARSARPPAGRRAARRRVRLRAGVCGSGRRARRPAAVGRHRREDGEAGERQAPSLVAASPATAARGEAERMVGQRHGFPCREARGWRGAGSSWPAGRATGLRSAPLAWRVRLRRRSGNAAIGHEPGPRSRGRAPRGASRGPEGRGTAGQTGSRSAAVSRSRSLSTALPWIWQARLSVTPSTSPISARVRPSK